MWLQIIQYRIGPDIPALTSGELRYLSRSEPSVHGGSVFSSSENGDTLKLPRSRRMAGLSTKSEVC